MIRELLTSVIDLTSIFDVVLPNPILLQDLEDDEFYQKLYASSKYVTNPSC